MTETLPEPQIPEVAVEPQPLDRQTATMPGVLQYERGQQTVINNHNVNNNNIGALPPLIGSGVEPGPGPATAPTPDETLPTGETDEVAGLREQVSGLREQVQTLTTQIQQLLEQQGQILQLLLNNNQLPLPTEPVEPEPQEPQLTPEEQAAEEALDDARTALLEITIRRKARMNDSYTDTRREDRESYDDAMLDYRAALAEYLNLRRATFEAGEPTPTEEQVRLRINELVFEEMKIFAEDEVDLNNQFLDEAIASAQDQNILKRVLAKRYNLIRRWADLSTKKKIMAGLLVGGGVAVASGTLGLGLFGLAAGSAARFSLGLLNKKASARNVSEKSLDQEIRRIERMESGGFQFPMDDEPDMEEYTDSVIDRVEYDIDGRIQYAQRRNKIGNAVLLASGLMVGLGAAGVDIVPPHSSFFGGGGGGQHGNGAGFPSGTEHVPGATAVFPGTEHIPNTNGVPFFPGIEHAPSPGIDFSHFHPDSVSGTTGSDAVRHAMNVFERNNIHVSGLTPEKIHAINQDLVQQHWRIASGVDATGRQHVVNWPAGRTENAGASALEGLRKVNGSSVENWHKFMEIAQRHGVKFTQRA